MKLTPLDIKKQEFTRSFRGFDVEEVQAFLQMLSNQWEELLAEQRRLEQRVSEVESKLKHYERIEEALQEALETARESSRQALDSARQKADQIIDEAERRAEEIRREAERNRHDLKRGVDDLIDRQNLILARLRAFLSSEMELLTHFETSDPEKRKDVVRNAGNGSGNQIQEVNRIDEPGAERIEQKVQKSGRTGSQIVNESESKVDLQHEESAQESKNQGNSTWTMREIISNEPSGNVLRENVDRPGAEKNDTGSTIASSDEIERIRRILRDLD